MTIYDDLQREEAEARRSFSAYERECYALSQEVFDELRAQLGFPASALGRAKDPDPLPEDCSSAMPGGWFDRERRYSFLAQAEFGHTYTRWLVRIWRDKGAWYVSFAEDNPVQIDRGDKKTIQPLVEGVIEASRNVIETFYPKDRLA